MSYTFPEVIASKQSANILSAEQIKWFIKEVSVGNAHDAQIGALLMAIFLQGMSKEETANLTSCMKNSGDVLSWPKEWRHLVVDKHSTGGVGDKISLVLAPALAACGLKVPMISGRSLGHTGGTLDKLESIPGYNVKLSSKEMVDILEKVGCCIVGQTSTLVPADKILYGIRDITSTVSSPPLMVSSIISKKASEGLTCLVLDVKFGRGCFNKSTDDAIKLAHLIVSTSQAQGIKTTAFVTRMEEPLGFTVGNSLEVIESVECMQNNGPADVMELVTTQGGELLMLNGQVKTLEEGKERIQSVIANGQALQKFKEMLIAQGVSEEISNEVCKNPKTVLPLSKNSTQIMAGKSGIITGIDALECAIVSSALGAGRLVPTDSVTHDTGLLLHVSRGDTIEAGQPWVTVYHVEEHLPPQLKDKLESVLSISENTVKNDVEKFPVIYTTIRDAKNGRPIMECQ